MFENNKGIQDLKEDGFSQTDIDKLIEDLKKSELAESILNVSSRLMIVKGISCKSWAIKEVVKELWENDTDLKELRNSTLVSDVQFFIDPEQKENVRALTSY
jgi:hypothetical protein